MKKSIFYTRKFNKIIGNTIEEDGYIYKIIISSCDASFYLGSEEEKKKIASRIENIKKEVLKW